MPTTSNAVLLPSSVVPKRYDLSLAPDFKQFTFKGEETIDIEVLESATEIVLNADKLSVESAEVSAGRGQSLSAEDIRVDKRRETLTLVFPRPLPVGEARLHIVFSGTLGDNLVGFYRAAYRGQGGEERWMAATQFEASHARLAFPCWDEPALKARFKVSLTVPLDMVAISNMPIEGESRNGQRSKQVRFEESPPMSTYLLAFVVGDLAQVEQEAAGGTLMRVWATRGNEEKGRFALETAVRLLAYYNDYFGIPFPLKKLDHLAIPDFAAGAMENWGAITYREAALLIDPEQSSAATRQRVAEIVAHEMAHMWFGDLVTMQWWNDLWLNESFASWMGSKAVDHLFPDWQMWTQFVNDDTVHALGLDGLANSHPIEAKVRTPADVEQIFDAISYSKGASLVRMLEHFLGEETFRKGLRDYLSAHTYGNARTQDLWAAMGRASGQPVGELMSTWTRQMGYPVISAIPERRAGRMDIRLSQSRFAYAHILDSARTYRSLWHVPISVVTSWSEPVRPRLMTGRKAVLQVEGAPSSDDRQVWAKVNPGEYGFFRVSYAPEQMDALRQAVHAGRLGATDRLGLQNDTYALARAGYIPATQFLSLAGAYTDETDASVWRDIAANLGDMHGLVAEQPYDPEFQAFARDLFRPTAQRMGWEPRPGEGHLDALLRSTVLSQVGFYGDEETLRTAQERFEAYHHGSAPVRPDIRAVVYQLAAWSGSRHVYDALWELERKADLQEEKVRLLMALTRFQQPDLLQETLARTLTDDVRVQDAVSVISGVAFNPKGLRLAWDFVKANWEEMDRRYGRGGFALNRLVGIAGHFTTRAAHDDVASFFKEHPTPAASLVIKQALEQIQLNAAWLDRHRDDLARWAKEQRTKK